eukprot:m51a1_g5924 hypothetical protein (119) ;mRNA; f:67345-68041
MADWKSGPLDCADDVAGVVLAWICPCFILGTNAGDSDTGSCIVCGLVGCICSCCMPCFVYMQRKKVRAKYGIKDTALLNALLFKPERHEKSDWIIDGCMACYAPCALAQMRREIAASH